MIPGVPVALFVINHPRNSHFSGDHMSLMHSSRTLASLTLSLLLAASTLNAQTAATAPPAPTTAVLTTLTVKADADRSKIPGVMPQEIRDTVRLYLDGKIQQWWARADGRGVVFVLNVRTVAEAKALTDTLPLSKANLADFEYTALTPLTPLRLLLTDPAK
jgi:hypothetical protein